MAVQRFRKKPVVIEAIEWTGKNVEAVFSFVSDKNASYGKEVGLGIRTLEGNHTAQIGDMIIKGGTGGILPLQTRYF